MDRKILRGFKIFMLAALQHYHMWAREDDWRCGATSQGWKCTRQISCQAMVQVCLARVGQNTVSGEQSAS